MLSGGRATATWGGAGAADWLGSVCDGCSGAAGLGSDVLIMGSGAGSAFATACGGVGAGSVGRGAGALGASTARAGAGGLGGGLGAGRARTSGGATGRDGLPSGAFSSGRSGAWNSTDVTMARASVRCAGSLGSRILHFTRSIMARPPAVRGPGREGPVPLVKPS